MFEESFTALMNQSESNLWWECGYCDHMHIKKKQSDPLPDQCPECGQNNKAYGWLPGVWAPEGTLAIAQERALRGKGGGL